MERYLEKLVRRHRSLDAIISREHRRSPTSSQALAHLKRLRLAVKDKIVRLRAASLLH